MIFASYEYLGLLLATLLLVFATQRLLPKGLWLICFPYLLLTASVVFYADSAAQFLPIIGSSILINFFLGQQLRHASSLTYRKLILWLGISINLAAIFYYKYTPLLDGAMSQADIPYGLNVAIPLGISFFTFQQMSYLLDCYKQDVPVYRFSDYCLYIMFFPQLIAGPIVRHNEFMPRLQEMRQHGFGNAFWVGGIVLISVGLFKKLVFADSVAPLSDFGFAHVETINPLEAATASVAFSLQLYFDFSGYADIAIGTALLFGFKLPFNFDSPYQSPNVQVLWSRWNMTLTAFFRDYLFRALGGYKRSIKRQYIAIFAMMCLIGMWHGGTWLFIVWGALHGIVLVLHRLWRRSKIRLPFSLGVMFTLAFIVLSNIFFRAPNLDTAWSMLQLTVSAPHYILEQIISGNWPGLTSVFDAISHRKLYIVVMFFSLCIVLFARNSNRFADIIDGRINHMLLAAAAFSTALMFLGKDNAFIYFLF